MAGRTTARRIPDPEIRRRLREQMERERSARRRRRWLWTAVPAAAVAVIALIVFLPHRGHGTTPPGPVSKVAENKRACLLTDPGQPAAPTVLAGLAAAARQLGDVNTQQIALPPSTTDAASSLAGLIQQHCTVVVALGPLSTTAADAAALNKETGATQLVEITDHASHSPGVTVIPATNVSGSSITSALVAILK